MIKSMTGFGRCELTEENRKYTVEIKSVNHRYLDLNLKMPKTLNAFESAIRALLKDYMERGKADIYITYENLSENDVCLKYNEALAEEYLKHLTKMAEKFEIKNDIKVSSLSRFPDIFVMEQKQTDENELWFGLEKAVRAACEQFAESRRKEGAHLKEDLKEKLGHMLSSIDFIEERAPLIRQEYRQRLENKVREILSDTQIDEARIAAEVVLYTDKICVDEETVRLRSHIKTALDTLEADGSIGRRLDFIAQEMNREANTILSKANDLAVSDAGIDLKTTIEKVREQIQNIE